MSVISYAKALEIIKGGENAVLRFNSNWEAIQFVNWLREIGFGVDKEMEVFRNPSKQIRYSLGRCVGTSAVGYDSNLYVLNAEVKASTFYDLVRKVNVV